MRARVCVCVCEFCECRCELVCKLAARMDWTALPSCEVHFISTRDWLPALSLCLLLYSWVPLSRVCQRLCVAVPAYLCPRELLCEWAPQQARRQAPSMHTCVHVRFLKECFWGRVKSGTTQYRRSIHKTDCQGKECRVGKGRPGCCANSPRQHGMLGKLNLRTGLGSVFRQSYTPGQQQRRRQWIGSAIMHMHEKGHGLDIWRACLCVLHHVLAISTTPAWLGKPAFGAKAACIRIVTVTRHLHDRVDSSMLTAGYPSTQLIKCKRRSGHERMSEQALHKWFLACSLLQCCYICRVQIQTVFG